ncbi:lysozyme inhibitor LprI family protein [Desulfotalea psychrophila]|uniref:Lysozyme inhibitor LprI-like N-terminal domain-containing protein n=1 Tax=Desulfotalea psychrophila (strain LSv54 / DSM 12343) TaxID=177439 RepID=Q6APG9_DESPS|nr:lysozyme inhibitor LprI family protein [Desulfotalea psychrophila]CAG35755.1 unknown protein [Desulfotalea psychrophila LSv54]
MKKRILLCIFLLFALPAQAEELITVPPAEKQDWQNFIDGAEDNYSMQARAAEAMHSLDSRIDEVVIKINRDLDQQAITLLKSNQTAWEKQICTKCIFLADSYRGGSHKGLAYGDCVIQEQKVRIAELKQMHEYRISP